MARSIGDVPEFRAYSTQYNLTFMPFTVTFTGGTVSSSTLPFGIKFDSKTSTGLYRFVVPAAVATKAWFDARTTANTICTFPSATTVIPTGYLSIQTGTTSATTATDPADGVILTGWYAAGWGK